MNAIHYNIKSDAIVNELKVTINSKIDKIYWMDTLILIEPEKSTFKNIVELLYGFFKEHKLEIEDFVYIYNFSSYKENNWYCERLKRKGLKRMSSNFK
ncbi:hypothetical protein NHF50_12600 [Flavobacterium sp. NRK F10]|uniref:hypothetical protein n=1 Tax=Flavobacterium sp. NRK F10 TaxID=2954931 RepID=UPI0020907065|nr:hypothetical protein [Flavobacterium sp. NRK F10]MCO6175884.1 hypothetical protein [Flavobacterium sp. NRK F10]